MARVHPFCARETKTSQTIYWALKARGETKTFLSLEFAFLCPFSTCVFSFCLASTHIPTNVTKMPNKTFSACLFACNTHIYSPDLTLSSFYPFERRLTTNTEHTKPFSFEHNAFLFSNKSTYEANRFLFFFRQNVAANGKAVVVAGTPQRRRGDCDFYRSDAPVQRPRSYHIVALAYVISLRFCCSIPISPRLTQCDPTARSHYFVTAG